MHIAYLHFHTVWIISSRYLPWSRHFSEQPSSAELIRWEIMNMTWCLIITNHDPDHHLTCPGCLLITDLCWVHNPELSHHDRARQAQPFSGAAYNGKRLRFSFSQCFLNQSRCHTREKVGGRTWGKLDLACHPLIGWYWSRDLNTGLGLVGANQDGHWLLPPVFILDHIFTLCVVTSLLFAHLCFTPNQLFSTWFPNPWLTLLSTAKSLFLLFSGFLSRGHHLFFSYAFARIRVIFIEIRVFPTNGLWLHL